MPFNLPLLLVYKFHGKCWVSFLRLISVEKCNRSFCNRPRPLRDKTCLTRAWGVCQLSISIYRSFFEQNTDTAKKQQRQSTHICGVFTGWTHEDFPTLNSQRAKVSNTRSSLRFCAWRLVTGLGCPNRSKMWQSKAATYFLDANLPSTRIPASPTTNLGSPTSQLVSLQQNSPVRIGSLEDAPPLGDFCTKCHIQSKWSEPKTPPEIINMMIYFIYLSMYIYELCACTISMHSYYIINDNGSQFNHMSKFSKAFFQGA